MNRQRAGYNSTSEFMTAIVTNYSSQLMTLDTRVSTVETNTTSPTTFKVRYNNTVENDTPMFRTERARDESTAVQIGDKLGSYEYWGHDGMDYGFGCGIKGTASESWTPIAHGTQVEVFTTPTSTTIPTANLTITPEGSVIVGSGSIPTTATSGFLYITACGDTPSGTPRAIAGRVPMCFDTTNDILYVYSGGAWRGFIPGV